MLSRDNHIVIAAVREPKSASSQGLHDLLRGQGSKVIVLKIESVSETEALAAVDALKSPHGITRLDIVIANAGIAKYIGKAERTPVKEMLDHFTINSVAPLLFFHATSPCSPFKLDPNSSSCPLVRGASELGNVGVRGMGHSEALVAIQDGVNGVLDRIDTATRERSSGKFLSWDIEELPW
ncbi:hypothetical protein BDV33DRAFT_198123 [Aspergillus novoparasiticus]|uniref:Uncharacterized protein n=1 Tax=Aspergillus novoparasiticus TaxID=986946 RepID=A0A5N6F745_9EURO|nr:hypothetical protein BDV33DRAFT_198123 [Aspergillus novoparasiticus]